MRKPKSIVNSSLLCPLCGKVLNQQDKKDLYGHEPVVWCPTTIKFQGGKQKFHYEFDAEANIIYMIVMPYRVVTTSKDTTVSVHIPPDHPKASDAYKTGKWLFRTVFHCPKIFPMEQDKLLKKIKTLLIFS